MKHHEQPTLSVVMIMVFIAIIVLILAALAICSHTSTKLGGLVKPSRLNYMPRRRPPYYGGSIDEDDKKIIMAASNEAQNEFDAIVNPLIEKYKNINEWTKEFPKGDISDQQIDLIDTFIDDTDLGKFLNCFEKPVWYSTPIVPVVSHPKDLQELKSWNWNKLTDTTTAIDIITKSTGIYRDRKFMILLKSKIDRSLAVLKNVSISSSTRQDVWEGFLENLLEQIYRTAFNIFSDPTYRANVVSNLVVKFLSEYDVLATAAASATAAAATAATAAAPAASPAGMTPPLVATKIDNLSQLTTKPEHFNSIVEVEQFTQAFNTFSVDSAKTIGIVNTSFDEANASTDKIESLYTGCANTRAKIYTIVQDIKTAMGQDLTTELQNKLKELKDKLEETDKGISNIMGEVEQFMVNLIKRSEHNKDIVKDDLNGFLENLENNGKAIANQELATLKSDIEVARRSGTTPTLALSPTVPELKVEDAWAKIPIDPDGKIFRAPYEKSLDEEDHITKYNELTYTNYMDWLKQKGDIAYKNLISNNDPTDYIQFIDVDDINVVIPYSEPKANKYLRKLLSTCIEDELKKNPVLASV